MKYKRHILLAGSLTGGVALFLVWYVCCPLLNITKSVANLAGTSYDGAYIAERVMSSKEKRMVVTYEEEDGTTIGTVISVGSGRMNDERNLGAVWRKYVQELSDGGLIRLIRSGSGGGSVYKLTWKGYLLALVSSLVSHAGDAGLWITRGECGYWGPLYCGRLHCVVNRDWCLPSTT